MIKFESRLIYPFYLKMRNEQITTEDKIISNRSEDCGVRNEGWHHLRDSIF